MIYKAIDRWNSPSLAHYGVKGMKWGVRHDRLRNAVARTGRVVRVAGGAVKKSASTIAKGIWRTGSAVRRFKNRRAIKSANVNRILKRANKMNNQELSDALTRVQLKNQISNQNRGGNSRSLGETVANSLKDKAANMAANTLSTSVDSLLRGELPTTGLIRNAQAQRALQEKQISENKMNTISNNYKINNSYLQNKMNVSAFNAQIAKNNLAAEKDRQSLRDLNNDSSLDLTKNTISSIKHTVTLPDGKRAVQRSLNSSNSYLYAPLSEATKYRYKPQSDTSYKVASYITNMYPKDFKHFDMKVSDLDNYRIVGETMIYEGIDRWNSSSLAHHGVKGMKWGIRNDPEKFAARKKKTAQKINSLYDHTNKWTRRKIKKLDAKGKTAKRDAMKYMLETNEVARKAKLKALNNMNADDYIKSRRTDAADFLFGGQDWIDRNSSAMTTFVGRWNEYSYQRGMRWASNFTREKTLRRFGGGKGAYNYLDRKTRYSRGYSAGVSSR